MQQQIRAQCVRAQIWIHLKEFKRTNSQSVKLTARSTIKFFPNRSHKGKRYPHSQEICIFPKNHDSYHSRSPK